MIASHYPGIDFSYLFVSILIRTPAKRKSQRNKTKSNPASICIFVFNIQSYDIINLRNKIYGLNLQLDQMLFPYSSNMYGASPPGALWPIAGQPWPWDIMNVHILLYMSDLLSLFDLKFVTQFHMISDRMRVMETTGSNGGCYIPR